jgi:hypothetical protein
MTTLENATAWQSAPRAALSLASLKPNISEKNLLADYADAQGSSSTTPTSRCHQGLKNTHD